MEQVSGFLIVAAVFLAVILLVRRRSNLTIVVRRQDIHVSGQALAAKAARVHNFFKYDLAEVQDCRVQGFYNGKYLQLWISGQLSAGQQQRIRNFLLDIL